MKITFSYEPGEKRKVSRIMGVIMSELPPCSLKLKRGKEPDAHGRVHAYLTTRRKEEAETLRAEDLARSMRKLKRRMDNLSPN